MKIVEKLCAYFTKKIIIPQILKYNPSARLISQPRVTRGGYFCPARMSNGGITIVYWDLPVHCSMVLIPEEGSYILWHGKKIIEVEE